MKFEKNRFNYSVDSIERSIVMDNSIGNISLTTKQKLYKDAIAKLSKYPELEKLIDIKHIRTYPFEGVKNFVRTGTLPSKIVISDQRIRDMCRNPFWYSLPNDDGTQGEMRFGPCPFLKIHSSCPYHSSLSSEKIRAKLDRSDILIVIQTKLLNQRDIPPYQFPILHKLTKEIKNILGPKSVVQKFGCGHCRACKKPCLGNGDCRKPELQISSFESQGIAVGQLTRDLSFFSGNKAWEVKFLKHFGMPNMTPKKWKYSIGLAIKLPGN